MIVLGLDLSLSAPGIAYDDEPRTLLATNRVGAERLSVRCSQVIALLDHVDPSVVVLEDYAFSKHEAGVRSNAELGGVVRLVLHDRDIPVALVKPNTMKKYATGNGSAGKDKVIAAAIDAGASIPQRRAKGGGREYDDNAADAWWLWQMGLARYAPHDERVRAVPPFNRPSLNAVKWPRLSRKARA